MKITIEPHEEIPSWQDGDWDVRFFFDTFIVATTAVARDGYRAVEEAWAKTHELTEGTNYECEEVVVRLCGVYT